MPGRFHPMGCQVMGIQCILGGPRFDQDKMVRVARNRVQIIVQAAMLGPDLGRQPFECGQLLRTFTGLGLDNHDKPNFI